MFIVEYNYSLFRRLDDNIRTVVRGQTNVGQDGRQVSPLILLKLNKSILIL